MVVTTAGALRLLPKIERGLGAERARLGTFKGFGTLVESECEGMGVGLSCWLVPAIDLLPFWSSMRGTSTTPQKLIVSEVKWSEVKKVK